MENHYTWENSKPLVQNIYYVLRYSIYLVYLLRWKYRSMFHKQKMINSTLVHIKTI